MSLEVRTSVDNGLLFYAGPSSVKPSPLSVQGIWNKLNINIKICLLLIIIIISADFMSLELKDGYPVLLVDYGSGTLKIGQKQIKISDGEPHRIEIIWTKTVLIILHKHNNLRLTVLKIIFGIVVSISILV